MTERNGIEIDYCPNCRGVWLDRGEPDKIIERSYPNVKNSPSEYLNERSDYKYAKDKDYRYKKPKNFLGDLFDF